MEVIKEFQRKIIQIKLDLLSNRDIDEVTKTDLTFKCNQHLEKSKMFNQSTFVNAKVELNKIVETLKNEISMAKLQSHPNKPIRSKKKVTKHTKIR
ncbi:hypothetical protein NUSPORA_02876 [Nucleospora cyclopteri]